MEAGIVHPQRLEYPFAEKLIERLVGDDFDDAAQHIGIKAVIPVRARLPACASIRTTNYF
jgi:hypothetical protein